MSHSYANIIPECKGGMDAAGSVQGAQRLDVELRRYSAVILQAQNPPRMADFEPAQGIGAEIPEPQRGEELERKARFLWAQPAKMRPYLILWAFTFAHAALFAQNAVDEDAFLNMDAEASGVTVTGIRYTTPQTQVITKKDIERRQSPDLATLLSETLDIGITAKGAYGNKTDINIRGFNTERIGVLINGVPANDPRTGEFDVSRVDLSNIEQIEVIYGGSDSAYNVTGAMGGIINIITKKRQEEGWSVGGGVSNTGYVTGSYNKRRSGGKVDGAHYEDVVDTQKVNVFAAYGGPLFSGKVSLFATRAENHYLYKDPKGKARRKESNEVYDGGAEAALSWNFANHATLTSNTGFFGAVRHFPVTGYAVGFAEASDATVRETVNLTMPVFLNEKFSCEVSADSVFAGNEYGNKTSSNDQFFTVINRWGWYPLKFLTVRSGIDWRFIHVDSTDNGARVGNQGGVYLAAEYKPWKPLTLVASIKGATDTAHFVPIPKGGFVWQAVDRGIVQFAVKNNYFRSFKFPDFDDLYRRSFDGMYEGNPALEPEDGIGLDLTLELVIGDFFNVSTTAYGQKNTNAIHWVKYGSRWLPENIGFSEFYGGDIRPAFTLKPKKPVFGFITRLKLGANYQIQYSWLMTDGLDYDDAVRIPYMPTHIAGGSVDVEWKTGSFLVSAHWESLRYADVQNIMPLEAYCLVNATFNQDIGRHVTVSAGLRNALNWLYTSFAEYPMPGLSFTVGVRVKWSGLGGAGGSKSTSSKGGADE